MVNYFADEKKMSRSLLNVSFVLVWRQAMLTMSIERWSVIGLEIKRAFSRQTGRAIDRGEQARNRQRVYTGKR